MYEANFVYLFLQFKLDLLTETIQIIFFRKLNANVKALKLQKLEIIIVQKRKISLVSKLTPE